MPGDMKVHYSASSNEWETPKELFDVLDEMLGPFTLDPCATAENAKTESFFTKDDDGLSQSWSGHNVFMNPPYGREIGKWIAKAHAESKHATVTCLLPARTDTAYWHEHVMKAHLVYLIRGRVRFVGGKGGAPFPSCVAVFARNPIEREYYFPLFKSLDLRYLWKKSLDT